MKNGKERYRELIESVIQNDPDNTGPEVMPLLALPAGEYLTLLKEYKEYHALTHEEQFLREVFGRSTENLVTFIYRFPPWKHRLVQKALFSVLSGWKTTREVSFDFRSSRPVEVIHFNVDYRKTEEVIKNGAMALNGPDNGKVAVKFYLVEDREEGRPRSDLFITCEKERRGWLRDIGKEIEEWMDKNNYLKGKKLKPDASFLDSEKVYTWDDIVLNHETREEIKRNINSYFDPLLRKGYRRNNIPIKRGLILHGPPGTGKTMLGKVISSTIDATFIWVTPKDVQFAKDVYEIFEMGRGLSPTVLFFEDLDLYASTRSHTGNTEVLGEFLAQMDGFIENEDIFVIGTTNDIKAIEPALKDRPSRFDTIIEFKPLDNEGQRKLLMRSWEGSIIDGDPDQLADEVSGMTKDLTGAELKEFVISAIKIAIDKRSIDEEGRAILSPDIFRTTKERAGNGKRVMGFGS